MCRPIGHSHTTARNITANLSAQLNTNQFPNIGCSNANHTKTCSVGGRLFLLEHCIWNTKLLECTEQHNVKQNTILNKYTVRVSGIISIHMWESQIKTGYSSVTCFNCITEFNALYRCASTKGGGLIRASNDSSDIHTFTKCVRTLAEAKYYINALLLHSIVVRTLAEAK